MSTDNDPARSGADELLDHIAQHHPEVGALLAAQSGDLDDVVADFVARGWTVETTERVAGKRVRILVAPAPGSEIPGQPGYVVGECGHRVARSEWRAGFRTCERCPAEQDGAKRG